MSKVHFAVFWILWSKMKITQADTPTVWMDCHPIQTNWCPTYTIFAIFTQDALPYTTLPSYPGLGQAPNMLACIPGGLVLIGRVYDTKIKWSSRWMLTNYSYFTQFQLLPPSAGVALCSVIILQRMQCNWALNVQACILAVYRSCHLWVWCCYLADVLCRL